MNAYGFLRNIGPMYGNDYDITTDTIWSTPQQMGNNIIVNPGVTLTIQSHLTMHRDAQIFIDGGKLIVDGGVIHNGYIYNEGSLIIRNNGIVEMRSDDQLIHNPQSVPTNGIEGAFPITMQIQSGGFKRINN